MTYNAEDHCWGVELYSKNTIWTNTNVPIAVVIIVKTVSIGVQNMIVSITMRLKKSKMNHPIVLFVKKTSFF